MKKLLNRKMKLLKNQQGLTLVELLVVIVILGIIAAIAIPMVISNKDDAAEKAAKQTNAIVLDAASRYEAVEGSAPDSFAVLVTSKYLAKTPECPGDYKVNTDTDFKNYCVK
ncbi:prepilin-type N-terminal cleavage/methylation domain-containing protein [Cytobacillus sp. NCCP-133]|uniref:prepilin-type N-terminal cleavage/methylation domain-containing protein n=1 Tax=Cytobacillus sp. NCCP-133 TaxID=766848 RepID=UPI0022300D49|nr:prepilin-type N-terminal cleavage/methylation domain-containing protein [Cytobacillus sp. NCCP-133]GLB58383.1 hypothetical protein NCCP133_05160 [Cytobacillus sp. NCCP-133]